MNEDTSVGVQPQDTSTPIKATSIPGRCPSGGKINMNKVNAAHLIFAMQDRQEAAHRGAVAGDQVAAYNRTSRQKQGSSGSLPHGLPVTLPNLPGEESSAKPSNPTPEAPTLGTKRPHNDDNEIIELPPEDEPATAPKKKKKKKNKNKPTEEVPHPEVPDDEARPSSSTAPAGTRAIEPTTVPALSGMPEKETEPPKKKNKKNKRKADFEKFREQEREAKAKEMAKAMHRKHQHEQDFRAVRDYRKNLPDELLNTINGADHSGFLLQKLEKEGNYMSKRNGHRRNLMTVKKLLSWIAKHANEPAKYLKEAQSFIKSTFPMVQGMPSRNKWSPELAVQVLMDCFDECIDCEDSEYGNEQNIGLHDVIHPTAMARVMATETYTVEGIPTTVRVDFAYCPFCSYTASHHRSLNNHVRMHFRAMMVCGWPGCYFVHIQAFRMIEHSAEAHGMARAKPACEKGGD